MHKAICGLEIKKGIVVMKNLLNFLVKHATNGEAEIKTNADELHNVFNVECNVQNTLPSLSLKVSDGESFMILSPVKQVQFYDDGNIIILLCDKFIDFVNGEL